MWREVTFNGRVYRVSVAAVIAAACAMRYRDYSNRRYNNRDYHEAEAACLDRFAELTGVNRRFAFSLARSMHQKNLLPHPEFYATQFPNGGPEFIDHLRAFGYVSA